MSQTIHGALEWARAALEEASQERALNDARLLLESCLEVDRQILIAYPERLMSEAKWLAFQKLIARRQACEPVSQILGQREFWGQTFKVSRDTLTPRPDSETLIEAVLTHFKDQAQPIRVLDLGVGTGCLLLSVLSEFEKAQGVGLDQSRAALDIAKQNAKCLGFEARCSFLESNWFEAVQGKFDVILANPPYIAFNERDTLSADVREYEPECALFADENGLADYRAILSSLRAYLTDDGLAFFELGQGQANAVSDLAETFDLRVYERVLDLSGIERCLVIGK